MGISDDTWEFAHHFIGRLYRKWGLYLLIFTLLMEFILMGIGENGFTAGSEILWCIQILALILPIFPTEYALRKNFDSHGHPIQKTASS